MAWEAWEQLPAIQSKRGHTGAAAGGGDGTQLPGMDHGLPQLKAGQEWDSSSQPLWS